jgi:hypothetical protein
MGVKIISEKKIHQKNNIFHPRIFFSPKLVFSSNYFTVVMLRYDASL